MGVKDDLIYIIDRRSDTVSVHSLTEWIDKYSTLMPIDSSQLAPPYGYRDTLQVSNVSRRITAHSIIDYRAPRANDLVQVEKCLPRVWGSAFRLCALPQRLLIPNLIPSSSYRPCTSEKFLGMESHWNAFRKGNWTRRKACFTRVNCITMTTTTV